VSQPFKNLLLTGPPGCGKTTCVRRPAERLSDLRLGGLYTAEIRAGGSRLGFEAVGLSAGRHAVLAPLVVTELGRPAGEVDLFVVDEVGKMELFCRAFVDAVPRLLDGSTPVVATVAMKGGELIAAVKARPDVRLVEVTTENRDSLPGELEGWVQDS
jgi:nucleoside-triphosphatase